MTKLATINDYKRDVSRALRDANFQQLLNSKNKGDDPDTICAELKKLDHELTSRIKTAYDKLKQQHNTGGHQNYTEQTT
eukprot:7436433-Ditylum_brightwellii.AAC.1